MEIVDMMVQRGSKVAKEKRVKVDCQVSERLSYASSR